MEKLRCLLCLLALLGTHISLVSLAQAQSLTEDSSPTHSHPAQGRSIGAPQVLEIPIQAETLPAEVDDNIEHDPVPSGSGENLNFDTSKLKESLPLQLSSPLSSLPSAYLGLRYATADACLYLELAGEDPASRQQCVAESQDSPAATPQGVKVLGVIAGSPGERAGFQGVDEPPNASEHLVKAGIAILALSPVGPLAIPLAMAYDAYTSQHTPGDLIVAVGQEQVRTAQDFNTVMSGYQPGDTVSFTVSRKGEKLTLTARLEAEPSFPE